ncbi:MAG: NADPH-dependent oxidoreductase [Phycisphaerae bacterium]|nr:NADPH-dependent oxidoreductase [Phycisphaerae bacterium]
MTPSDPNPPVSKPSAAEVLALLESHRSIRVYTDEPIPLEDVHAAVRAGQMASTSSAVQAYCCIRVTDAAKRAVIAELAGPQEKVRIAPEFFVICGDHRRHTIAAERDGLTRDARLEAFLLAVIDASLFAEKMVIAFEAMGYGACYIGGLRNDLPRVDEVLGLPPGVFPLFGLCVGRPAQDPGRRPRLPIEAVLYENACPSNDVSLGHLATYDDTYREYLDLRGADSKAWSEIMAGRFSRAERENLSAYYQSKGARFD